MKARSRVLLAVLFVALVLPANLFAGAYMRTVSWNARHMGWSGETDWSGYANQVWQDYGTSSTSPNGCDIIFLQEVMYSSSASSFASALSSVSGVTWSYKVTSAVGRSSYKECYAVVYRTDRVTMLSSTLWTDTGDKFEREPQIVKIRDKSTSADYTFINWHCIWGTTAQREAEISAIADVFKSVQNASSTDQDVILLGDFNRDATSSYFSRLKSTSVISPVVGYKVNDKTTINSSCAFASPYDHYWYQASYVTEYSSSGRDYIANMCTFYSGLSDHAPIWLKLYSSSDTD
ncbi:deoxyribonuclease I [bacterium]|nr:deoxyribonuclease I [bacterium]